VGQASTRRLNRKRGEIPFVLFRSVCLFLLCVSFSFYSFCIVFFAFWIYSFICSVCFFFISIGLCCSLCLFVLCVSFLFYSFRFFALIVYLLRLILFHSNRFGLFCSLCLFVMFVSLSFHSFCLFLSTVCNFLLFLTFKFCFVLSFIFEHQSRSCSRILMRQKMKIKERRFDSRIIKDNNCWKEGRARLCLVRTSNNSKTFLNSICQIALKTKVDWYMLLVFNRVVFC